jgi:hypothetical protein
LKSLSDIVNIKELIVTVFVLIFFIYLPESQKYREYPASTIGAGLTLALSFKEFFSLK